jgi:hypothetical protein
LDGISSQEIDFREVFAEHMVGWKAGHTLGGGVERKEIAGLIQGNDGIR